MTRRFLIIFTLSIISCTKSNPLTEREKIVLADSIDQALKECFADIRKSGLTAEFKYLDSSPDFFWVPPGYSGPISYDSVARIVRQNAAGYRSIDNSFDTLRIIPLSRELATYTGQLRSIMTDTSDHTVTITMIETGTLIKRKDGWKFLSGQTFILNK